MAFSPAATIYTGNVSLHRLAEVYVSRRIGVTIQLYGGIENGATVDKVKILKNGDEPIVLHINPLRWQDNLDDLVREIQLALDREEQNEIYDIERDLRVRYPGKHEKMLTHIKFASSQLKHGQVFGVRQTPVVSFWLMRKKWENRGASWEQLATDGDAVLKDGGMIFPTVIQLAYFRTRDNLICQLAYPAITWDTSQGFYEKAKLSTPVILERSVIASGDTPTDDIVRHMSQIL